MCNIWAEPEKFRLSINEIGKTIAICKKEYGSVESVAITGGECFMHPDIGEIIAMLAHCQAQRIIEGFDITSNGYYVEKLQEVFKKHHQLLSSTEFSFAFSVDGLKETHTEQRGNPKSWERVTQSIQFLKDNYPNVRVVMRFCATMLNYKDIIPLYEWARSHEVSFIPKVAEFKLDSYYHRGPGGIRIPQHTDEMREHLKQAFAKIRDDEQSPMGDEPMQEILGYLETGKYSKTPCSTPVRSLFIDSRANVFPCLYYKPITNIRNENWQSVLFQNEHKRLMKLGLTKNCVGCIAYHGFLKLYNLKRAKKMFV